MYETKLTEISKGTIRKVAKGILIKIRNATNFDVPAIHSILKRGFAPLQARGYSQKAIDAAILSEEKIRKRLNTSKTYVLVAVKENQILGTVTGVENYQHLHVVSLVVDPKFQRCGIGYELMLELEKQARKNKCNKLFLQTALKMWEAIELYKRLGFALEGYHPCHFFGEDLLSFGKLLPSTCHQK
jgi:ribosomal protein S18 acetylase RimI-like enzyme